MSVVAPVIVSGNTAVVLTSEDRPLPAITLAECLATSDVPGGVVNIVTGRTAEVAPWLASHRDVNAIDLTGAAGADGVDWGALEEASAENLKRVLRPGGDRHRGGRARLVGDPRPVPAHGVPRDQDGLAPQGPLTRARPAGAARCGIAPDHLGYAPQRCGGADVKVPARAGKLMRRAGRRIAARG